MNRTRTVCVAAVLIAAVAPSSAEAALIRFCVRHTGTFDDSGFGEDHWTANTLRPALGQWAQVKKGANPLWSGYLTTSTAGAGQGCTPQFNQASPNGDYSITLESSGVGGVNHIYVWDAVGEPVELRYATAVKTINDNGATGTYPVDLSIQLDSPLWQTFNIYLAAAWGLWRMSGPLGDVTIHRVSSGGGYNNATDTVLISTGWARRKFLILHEVGHRVADLATQGVMNAAQNYDWYDPSCPRDLTLTSACDNDGDFLEDGGVDGTPVPGVCDGPCLPPGCNPDHGMRSMEYVGGAAGEGFAHFFAAGAWNTQNVDDNCVFRYYLPLQGSSQTVDCENAAAGAPRSYMRNICDGDDFNLHGVELDWLRAFWDVRTNTNAFGAPPTFIEMVTWLDHTLPWTYEGAFVHLDNQANLEGFRLDYAWDTAKAFGTADGNGL